MDIITIHELEVHYHIGVTELERAHPQRILVSLELQLDFTPAIASDGLADTVDYDALSRQLITFGNGCHWQLIETLAADIATMVLDDFRPKAVTVEVKKFAVPQARFVSARLHRTR